MALFIKDYGSIISPTIAFLLGIITVFIKNQIDSKSQRKQTEKSFEKAKEMLSKIRLPDYCEGPKRKNPNDLMHATMARNYTNIARMYFSLSAAYKYLSSLESDINKSNNLLVINQYFYLIWRIEKMIKELEMLRDHSNSVDIDASTWRGLQRKIPELLEFLNEDWFSLKGD